MSLTGVKRGEASCAQCGEINPAEIHTCSPQVQPANVDPIDILLECVDQAPKSEHVDPDATPARHRYAGSFGG